MIANPHMPADAMITAASTNVEVVSGGLVV
jgi:hypothetical protein